MLQKDILNQTTQLRQNVYRMACIYWKAEVRHLGTDINYEVLNKMLKMFEDNKNIDIFFNTESAEIDIEKRKRL